MSSRNINAVITSDTIALNALIYGYGGHSLVTPHHAIRLVWWTQDRIEEKVTRDFVLSRLRPHHREKLDEELSFGDGLTSDTYLDWILDKSRRMFLILEEIGIPDQIFTVIDHSWDDDDLPLSLEAVQQLSISYQIHEQLDRKFYDTQFTFLLRELEEGAHINYGAGEIIPLEYVHKLPPAVSLQTWNRVHLPQQPSKIFARRRVPLEKIREADFLMDIESSRFVEHEHLSPVWASYTSKNVAYFLTPFIGQHTLKTFIDHRSAPQYAKLSKHDRAALLLEWLHCLSSALAAIHAGGFIHSAIRPSNILIDADNHIAFADLGSLKCLQADKKVDQVEAYTYAAPEVEALSIPPSLSPDSVSEKASSISSKGSSEIASPTGALTTKSKTKKLSNNFSFDFGFESKGNSGKTKPVVESNQQKLHTEFCDVFSFGCIFLDVLTFMMRKKASDFVRHRSTKIKISKDNPKQQGKIKNKGSLSRLDPSFHNNQGKVASWMKHLEDAAFDQEDGLYRAVPHLLNLVEKMLSEDPFDRPSAAEVRDRTAVVLNNYANLRSLHCQDSHMNQKSKKLTAAANAHAQRLASQSSPNGFTAEQAAEKAYLEGQTFFKDESPEISAEIPIRELPASSSFTLPSRLQGTLSPPLSPRSSNIAHPTEMAERFSTNGHMSDTKSTSPNSPTNSLFPTSCPPAGGLPPVPHQARRSDSHTSTIPSARSSTSACTNTMSFSSSNPRMSTATTAATGLSRNTSSATALSWSNPNPTQSNGWSFRNQDLQCNRESVASSLVSPTAAVIRDYIPTPTPTRPSSVHTGKSAEDDEIFGYNTTQPLPPPDSSYLSVPHQDKDRSGSVSSDGTATQTRIIQQRRKKIEDAFRKEQKTAKKKEQQQKRGWSVTGGMTIG